LKSNTLRQLGALSLALATTVGTLAGCAQNGLRATTAGETDSWSAVAFSSPTERKGAVVYYDTRDKLTQLVQAGADVMSVDIQAKRAQVTLTADQAKAAEKLGMRVKWNDFKAPRGYDKGYRTYDQIAARLHELAAQAPEIATLVDIGDSWEKTQGKANRDIWALHLRKGTGAKPVVVFAACHHARELVTPEMALMEAEKLVTEYGKDAEVTAAVDNRDIWIVPMVNPDGHVIVETTGVDQRKNGNNVTGGKHRVGVDLNRNYDTAWGTVGDSGNPESDTFRGSKAFSEPETQAIRDLLSKVKPVVYLTFHSFSNSVMWSWDQKSEPPSDPRLAVLGAQLGKLSGYKAYQGCEMYLNSGDDVDWAFEHLGTLAYTVEVGSWGDGFMPPAKKVPQFWKENGPMMTHALKVADNPGVVFGPQLKAATTRSGLSFSAPGATKVELFRGRPGKDGTGEPVSLAGGQAVVSATRGPRELVFVHAQGPNGVWGPTEAVWSN
jgi:hypothetical protein